ncbi:MAG: hypothetical protein HQ486_07985 [Acidimicrobiaceae bacterium]|nr:hypothetical protein [Acidimicrobiaceae bacterium]
MGFLKKVFGAKEIVIDPADLTLPDLIATDKLGLTLKKAQVGQPVEIDIVGESFRVANISAVAKAAEGKQFEIYLVPEPNNQYDKRAVAVYAANVHVGYIGKPANTQWFNWVNEAISRGELLWGMAKVVSAEDTANTGIFGSIYMPKVGREVEELIPQKMTDAALGKAIEKAINLSNTCNEPETITQLKSLCKKAVGVAALFVSHAKWVEENPEGQDTQKWEDVMSVCDYIFDDFSDAAYASDEMEVDAVGRIQELAELVNGMKP